MLKTIPKIIELTGKLKKYCVKIPKIKPKSIGTMGNLKNFIEFYSRILFTPTNVLE